MLHNVRQETLYETNAFHNVGTGTLYDTNTFRDVGRKTLLCISGKPEIHLLWGLINIRHRNLKGLSLLQGEKGI